jgi:dTDP-glucose pyrophosphorylase
MHGLILAGGEGSRLAAEGIHVSKASVRVGGRPQILRLIDTFIGLGLDTVTCMVRDVFPDAFRALATAQAEFGERVRVVPCHTPSSLHTMAEGLREVPAGPVFASMVDTVMPERDWRRAYEESVRQMRRGRDGVLVVTPFVDDENPLWVERGPGGVARRIGGAPVMPPCVTGGVYVFGPDIRDAAEMAVLEGGSRIRYFLADLVKGGAKLGTVEIDRVVDLDHKHDIETADALLAAEGGVASVR